MLKDWSANLALICSSSSLGRLAMRLEPPLICSDGKLLTTPLSSFDMSDAQVSKRLGFSVISRCWVKKKMDAPDSDLVLSWKRM